MSTITSEWPSRTALAEEARRLGPWFHDLRLPDGTQTAPNHPLGEFPTNKWRQIAPLVPADLTGWTALDIGCNAGFYSFELARRGAQVTAIDYDERYLAQASWAASVFDLSDRVAFRRMQLYDLAHTQETYDLVWFMGVFYHLRYPTLGLDIVARKTRRMLVFQTMTVPGEESLDVPENLSLDDRRLMRHPGWPGMAFIEHRVADDPTNWWAANRACCEAMLRSSGLRVVARPATEIYICEPAEVNRGPLGSLLEEEYLAATGQRRPAACDRE